MTGRERVLCALENRAPDRIPVLEHFWKDTLDRWYGEGLSPGVNLNNYFDFDIREMGIDASPRFDAYVIDEDGEFRTIQDRFGYVARMYKDKSRMKKIGEYLLGRGLHFRIHSCGNCEAIFPDLIECGVKVINSLYSVPAGLKRACNSDI